MIVTENLYGDIISDVAVDDWIGRFGWIFVISARILACLKRCTAARRILRQRIANPVWVIAWRGFDA